MSDSADKMELDFMNSVATFDFNDPNIFHDRVLLVEDKKFYVQSGVLSIWSEYFKTLFNGEFTEKNKNEIELKDVSADEFNVFLQVIYPGLFEIQVPHVESLLDHSHRFLAPNVLEICKQFIEKEFDKIDKIMLFKVAEKHGMKNLKEKALDYVIANVEAFNLPRLLELAFEHDLQQLKESIRASIYTAEGEQFRFKCDQCSDHIQKKQCTHIDPRVNPIVRNSLIAKHINEIANAFRNSKFRSYFYG